MKRLIEGVNDNGESGGVRRKDFGGKSFMLEEQSVSNRSPVNSVNSVDI